MARAIEAFIALWLLAVTLPLTILILLSLLILSPGNPIFAQTRIGQAGRPFRLLKFRTMRVGRQGSPITVGNDQRITSIGRALRRFKLDEIPQLWNILSGQMSFVGPRPEVEQFVRDYSADERRILDYRPGLTDPASIKYRNEADLLAGESDPEAAYRERVLPDKIRISLEYQKQRTLASDLGVIWETIVAVFAAPRKTV